MHHFLPFVCVGMRFGLLLCTGVFKIEFLLEYGTYSLWSNWKQETVNNVEKLKRMRTCTSGECSGDVEETKDCTPSLCSSMQCFISPFNSFA